MKKVYKENSITYNISSFMKKSKIIEVDIHEFRLEEIPLSCTWMVLGIPGSGKSTLMENIIYYHKHRYPVMRSFIGTETGYKRWCEISHPLFCSNYYDEEEEKRHITRQRMCLKENVSGYTGNYAINLIDDVSDDPKVYKTKLMRGLFKLGSQHWAQICLVGIQYAIDMPPDLRASTSYVAIFRQPDESQRKKIFENFGGIAGSYERFCDLLDQLTGDYTCLIIKKRSQSNKLEDNIFFYKTRLLGDWRFGCKEYRKWGEERYDENFKEEFAF
jgi:hypothetical protein